MKPTLQVGDHLLVDRRGSLRGHWKRGDLLLFKEPELWGEDGDSLTKRLVGLPGEKFMIRAGKVYINGKVLAESYLAERPDAEIYGPIYLRKGQYFVMGDNRNQSDDSRDNGPIDESNIVGRAIVRLWPLSRLGVPKVN